MPDGRKIEPHLEDSRVDLILLDLMLPGEDGLGLCRRVRKRSDVPVIMVTARGEELDRIIGLEMGADDYLSKPFNPRELLARIRAVLRRGQPRAPIVAGPACSPFSAGGSIAWLRELRDPKGTRIVLTGAEFGLLQVLCERAGRVLSREQLLDLTQDAGGLARTEHRRSHQPVAPQDRARSARPGNHQNGALRRLSVRGEGRGLVSWTASLLPNRISGQIVVLLISSLVASHVVLTVAFFYQRPESRTGIFPINSQP